MADPAENKPRSLGSCLVLVVSVAVIGLSLMFLLLMVGLGRGEIALEDGDDPYRLSIDVADGSPGRVVHFGGVDVNALKLADDEYVVDEYDRGNTHVWVDTGWTNDEMIDGYCFSEPVTVVDPTRTATLIEPDECVDRFGRLDRQTIAIVNPLARTQVGDTVRVDVRIDLRHPENLRGSELRFFLNGELVRETSAYSSTGNVFDLTAVEPGPMTVRVEFLLPRGESPRSAAVVDLVRVPAQS